MKIKELLVTPDKWAQEQFARDKYGNATSVYSGTAKSFCLIGAVDRCYMKATKYRSVLRRIHDNIPADTNILRWNDDPKRTHAEVLELVTRLNV